MLVTLQDDSEDLEVRRRALEAVAVFDASRVKELIKWAYESANLDLKSSSLYAMGKTEEPYWLSFLFKELKNPNPPLRYEAANACGELEEEEAIPHLMPLTEDGRPPGSAIGHPSHRHHWRAAGQEGSAAMPKVRGCRY